MSCPFKCHCKCRPVISLLILAIALGFIAAFFVSRGETLHVMKTPAVAGKKTPMPEKISQTPDWLRATYNPLHFQPAIATAKDEECLACHAEVLEDKVRETSPAGIKASESLAWYQTLSTYQGTQDTFHRRHLTSDLAKNVMNLSCNTCHTGSDPRDEAPNTSATAPKDGFAMRKTVNVEQTCLKCHGGQNIEVMGLPSAWHESRALFGDSCLTCHAAIRTVRHQVNYLKAANIEAAGAKDSDVCFGCHGGRAWYRINYPYPRHLWPEGGTEVPDWAKNRPQASEARFRLADKKN